MKTSNGEITIVACPHPFRSERCSLTVAAGPTVAGILETVQPDPALLKHAHVFIDDWYIPPDKWHVVRPRAGRRVTVRVVPTGGGGKNPLRTILTIAVIAASFYFGPLLAAGIFGPALVGIPLSAFQLAVGRAIIGVVGMLLVSAIAPPARPKLADLGGAGARASPTLFIEGARNTPRLFGVIPRPLGRHRMVPPLGARSFTEIVGADQFLRVLVVWGHGPLAISDLKIGETPIGEFEDVEVETVQGFPGDPPLTLFPQDVFEDGLQVKLSSEFAIRTTQPNADEISVDVTYPQGLVIFNKTPGEAVPSEAGTGIRGTLQRIVDVEFSPAGADTWTVAGTIDTRANSTAVIRDGLRFTVERGQYDVRLKANPSVSLSGPDFSVKPFDDVVWTALRTITDEDPIKLAGLAKTAVRIKATDQLSRVVDILNGIGESIVPDWDMGTQAWIVRATSNPASLYRDVLQGPGNARPVADARIDLAALADWHEKNVAEGREFNMVRDFASTVAETLDDIAAAGRAAKAIVDGKWTVVIDEEKTVPIQEFTPRNSFAFLGEKVFVDLPHGFRVRFVNRDKDWRQDERIVFDDGFDETNATKFEELELPGITDPDQVFKDGRFHIAVARLRPEIFSFGTDIEHIVATRGDLVRLTHDVPLFGLASGRVKQIVDDGANATAVVLDETVTMEAGQSFSVRFRASDMTTSVHAVNTAPGETDTLTFTTPVPLASAPAVDDLAMFGETGTESVELIIGAIEPGADETARLRCVAAAPAVHQADQGTIPPFQSQITAPTDPGVPRVVGIQSDEFVLLRLDDGSLKPRIVVSLGAASARAAVIVEIEARFRPLGVTTPWTKVFTPPDAAELALEPVDNGVVYELRLRFLTIERAGDWTAIFTHTVIGTSTRPPDVPDLFIEAGKVIWSYPVRPVDFAGFRFRSNAGTDRIWGSATPAHDGLLTAREFTLALLPGGTRTIMVKAVDAAGNESAVAAAATIRLGDPIVANVIVTEDKKAKGFPGTVTGGSLVGGDLQADSDTITYLPIGAAPYLPDGTALYLSVTFDSMRYTTRFTPEFPDAPSTMTLRLTVAADDFTVEVRDGDGMLYLPIGADLYLPVGADLYLGGPPAFRPWPGSLEVTRRPIDLRVTTLLGNIQGVISGFDILLDVPDVIERLNDVAIAAGGARLPITRTFRQIIAIGDIAVQDDGGTAIAVRVIDKNPALGPLVETLDAAGASVSGTIDAAVQGF